MNVGFPQAAMVDSSLPLYSSASLGGCSLQALSLAMHEDMSANDDGSHSDSSLDLSPISAL